METPTRAGVDTGGTFTDFVWLDTTGRWHIHKQLSTPDDPSAAILAGLEALHIPNSVAIVHGSTVATNALLERRGARTALITTAGFADVLVIGRQNRPDLYALVPQKPEPLVPRQWRWEVAERIDANGEVVLPLDEAGLDGIMARLLAENVESVAICLLFSFLRPEHERRIRDIVQAAWAGQNRPLHLSLSSEILPEYREYERTAATVMNAYVAPLMTRYLSRLVKGVAPRPVTVMQSSGGVIDAQTAGEQAVRTVLSGPAGGVVGAQYLAAAAGYEQVITFDMGGTSTDVALCPGWLPATTRGEIAGLPLRLPVIDIHTVGAGGGSLAFVDAGGALHVGPQSAGANPGPISYDLQPAGWVQENQQVGVDAAGRPLWVTTTDANLVLGRLDADHFLGGTMPLATERARQALAALAARIGAAASGPAALDVITVANATMERAIRRISVERGYDPRRFTLVAFGGAGPLHACDLATRLQIPRVLVPTVPGVLSALGMLAAPPSRSYSRTVMLPVSPEWTAAELDAHFRPLEAQAVAEMTAGGHTAGSLVLHRVVDMRYSGQSHELQLALNDPAAPLAEQFATAHEQRYGYRQANAAVEVVTVRVTAVAPLAAPSLPAQPAGSPDTSAAVVGQKPIWFGREARPATLYARERLRPGNAFAGPAVIFQYDTTTVIPPGWQVVVDPFSNLVVTAG